MTQETDSIPATATVLPASLAATHIPRRAPLTQKIIQRGKLMIVLYGLMSLTIVGVGVFIFYPQFGAIKYSFYDWDGGQLVERFRGLGNYAEAFFQDKLFWPTFQLVLILLAANAIKMWPSIFTAIVLHRLRSQKLQYFFRVMFVVPLIIPSIVTLLVWKSFFDPQLGPLNKILHATGLLDVLRHLDTIMPAIATRLAPLTANIVERPFDSVWGLLWLGLALLTIAANKSLQHAWPWLAVLAGSGYFLLGGAMEGLDGATAVRIGIILAVIVAAIVLRRTNVLRSTPLRILGYIPLIAGSLFLLLAKLWTEPTHAFDSNTPAWLSHSKLIIPSLVLWGFPWVGTVGVLIYLAGLQNITQDVYEAAELDGVGSFGRLYHIELPLIVTQIRINLIFMTIGTLTDYGLVLLLLGAGGGPGGVGMTPGLYMYSTAFVEGRFGYACALGMVLAAIILIITVLYQRYVKVEK